MCGINGGYVIEQLSEQAITRSLDAIRHRGPDDAGLHRNGPAFIGMRRLSIIDLDTGDQPIFNEDGSVGVVFNGEIYNYPDLTDLLESQGHTFKSRSDTETLVHLYEEYGPAMCQHLRGMFAFAIWDSRQNCLFIARDRFGKKPLYYTRTRSGSLIFASELKALKLLAEALGERWTIRPQSVYDYLSLTIVPQPNTIYQGVYALPPGSWLRFDGENLEIKSYWSLDVTTRTRISYTGAQDRVRAMIGDAVRCRLRSDVPLGVFLSGGIDSSIVAYEAAQHVGETLETFTVGVDNQALDESPVAQRTAAQFGVLNTVLNMQIAPLESLQFLVNHYDQPYADSSAIPSLAISKLAREHVTVVLNGDGGDEFFGGYRRHLAAHLGAAITWLPGDLIAGAFNRLASERRTAAGFAARFLRGLGKPRAERYLIWTMDMLREADKQELWIAPPSQYPTESLVGRLLPPDLSGLALQRSGDIAIILLSDLLVKMDMATMAASLEGRSPFMDHLVAEFAVSLPDRYHVRGYRTKSLLRDAYRGRLPDEVLSGAKRGFEIPLVAWLKDDLHPLLMDTVSAPDARLRDYLDSAFIEALLDGQTMQDRNWGYIVYALLVLELWLRGTG